MTLRVFVVAGEASGDQLGAALLDGFKTLGQSIDVMGVGGPLMAARGLDSLFPYEELAVMGLAEILPKYFALKRRIRQTAEAVIEARPDVLITIDSPEFSFRVARQVKAASDIRIVHYVAPSVWAWRPGRAAKIAGFVDQLLALLPFEPPFFEAVGLRCDVVGHPVAEAPPAPKAAVEDFRAKHGQNITLALPGSRSGEVNRLAPVFGEALGLLDEPGAVVVPAVPHLRRAVEAAIATWPVPATVIGPEDKAAAFGAADLALAASGTVSLELAANDVPMVIAYQMAPLTRMILRRMVQVDTVTLVNLVSETRAVPEFLFERCTPEKIAQGLAEVRKDPEAQRRAMAVTMERLGRGQDPGGVRAAQAVFDGLRAEV